MQILKTFHFARLMSFKKKAWMTSIVTHAFFSGVFCFLKMSGCQAYLLPAAMHGS
jgi:hypothetical protein